MFNFLYKKQTLLICVLYLLSTGAIHTQTQEKAIYKKFALRDSLSAHKSAELIFYADGSFLNFGIYDNKIEKDLYVWYKAGSWILKDNQLLCVADDKRIKEDELKKLVKFHYRRHPDRVLITSYYEFVHESYTSGTLSVSDQNASDAEKKISYYPTQLNTSLQ
ncbi:hypothetical protein CNR22_18925 [Sphingobacteriaceae bacterium]|nr:hypothetical protein CNR22_18925 [Sphingobacteriaceae bacterium]